MGFRARWTEERFEEWFHARFDQWVAERFGERLKAELDQRMPTWADRVDSRFREAFDTQFVARFDSRFNDRFKAWQDDGMPGVDEWANNFFDTLFTVYADTWGDSTHFQQRFDERFDERFMTMFGERLESEVQARVANELAERIDRRIEQWLVAVRQELLDAAETPVDQPSDTPTERGRPDGEFGGPASPTVTAVQLAEYLKKKPLKVRRIRELLRGKEIPGVQPATYLLAEAAGTLLSRKTRGGKASKPESAEKRPDGDSHEEEAGAVP